MKKVVRYVFAWKSGATWVFGSTLFLSAEAVRKVYKADDESSFVKVTYEFLP